MAAKQNDYELLGLNEYATKEEVEHRYQILIKNHKQHVNRSEEDKDTDINEITRAYERIMGLDVKRTKKEMIPNAFDNFWYHNKLKVIFSVFIAVVLTVGTISVINRKDYDVNIAVTGNLLILDEKALNKEFSTGIEEINETLIQNLIIYEGQNYEIKNSMYSKLTAMLAVGEIDLFILDKDMFEQLCFQGAFEPLNELLNNGTIKKNGYEGIEFNTEQDEETYNIYGLDVTGSKIFEDYSVTGEKKILALSVRPESYDNALLVWDYIVSYKERAYIDTELEEKQD